MATVAQIQNLLETNAKFTMQPEEQQQALVEAFEEFGGGDDGGYGGREIRWLDGRRVREVAKFEGGESQCREFALGFKATTKQINYGLFRMIEWAEGRENDITELEVHEEDKGNGFNHLTHVHNRMLHDLFLGPALHQNGCLDLGACAFGAVSQPLAGQCMCAPKGS